MSDSQVRLQVTADRAASKHIGGSRKREKQDRSRAGHGAGTVDRTEMHTFGEERGGGCLGMRDLLLWFFGLGAGAPAIGRGT